MAHFLFLSKHFQVLSSSSLSSFLYIYIYLYTFCSYVYFYRQADINFLSSIHSVLVLLLTLAVIYVFPFAISYLPSYIVFSTEKKWNMCLILWCERDFQNDKWLLSVMSVIYQKSLLTRFQNISVNFFSFILEQKIIINNNNNKN